MKMPTTVQEILEDWLRCQGYDGLVSDGAECACQLDDLMPCSAPCDTCQPGYRGPDPSGEMEWLMYASKEAAEAATQATKELPQ